MISVCRFLWLVLSLIWREQVGAKEKMCRWIGPKCWKWLWWGKVRWTETGVWDVRLGPWSRPGVWEWIWLVREVGLGMRGACASGDRHYGKGWLWLQQSWPVCVRALDVGPWLDLADWGGWWRGGIGRLSERPWRKMCRIQLVDRLNMTSLLLF